ncbi:PREDICTED: uncharacterized protein LOC109464267 isoform X3 [Branchiostoma belcheri]|uniref:Uncharacterized protein LOC109464267 isoform X3 n=1 Tax=Branchiostoma belcheri TaxID=7741 RepID=A0A6P4XXC3_BRABE|nr:PREDICTED: uncharacterized protein LOC109464267 isoform X3 [Branchiostoma belcheri]
MGKFELEMFDPPPDQEFICSICRCVMEDPQECPCGHVFCKDCIQRWLRSHSTCPNCRKQCQQVKPVLPMVRNLISHLTIRCENHQAGCDKKVQLEYYDSHKEVCDYASVPCPNEGCDLHILRINMDAHNGVCDYHRDTCLKGCGISILRKEQAGHSCVLELKKRLEEQEQEKRSLKQKNEELQAKVDNLKFLCWRSRNYLKKNIHAKAPRILQNLCIDLENATGLAPDNTEGHRDTAIPHTEAGVLVFESGSSEYESSPPRPLDSSPSEYQSSPIRPLIRSPVHQSSPPHARPLDSSPSEYQSSPIRPLIRSPVHQSSPPRVRPLDSSPSEYQSSPPRPLDSSPSEYQSSPLRPLDSDEEEDWLRAGNRDRNTTSTTVGATDNAQSTAEDNNDERVEGGQAQPPEETRRSSEEAEQNNQQVDSTQANSRRTGNAGTSSTAVESPYEESPYEESPYEESPADSDSPSDDDDESESAHRANLRHLLSSDSDPTWSSPSEYQPSEGEEPATGNNVPEDDTIARRRRNVALRYGGGLRIHTSDSEEDRPSAGTVQNSTESTQQNSPSHSETAGERVVEEEQNTHPASDRTEDPEVVIAEENEELAYDEAVSETTERHLAQQRSTGVTRPPLVVRNFRNRHRGQRSRTNQGQGNSRSRGACRPQRGSARSFCSSARQTVMQTRSRGRDTVPPVITIGSSDGNQSPNLQRADTEGDHSQVGGGAASQQQSRSVQQTEGNENSAAEIVEINLSGAEEVTAPGDVRTRRQTRALRKRRTAQRRRPAQGTRRSGANAGPLESSGESDSDCVPVAPKRTRRHNGGRN